MCKMVILGSVALSDTLTKTLAYSYVSQFSNSKFRVHVDKNGGFVSEPSILSCLS